ncbi:MAG: hypothetical protein GX349_04780 [Firmicutes bacterium]|nr:hypothetical protein [Bacillota bacterium]
MDLRQTFKNTIKEEIMAELQARERYNFGAAKMYSREIDRLKREVFDEIRRGYYGNLPHQQDQLGLTYNHQSAIDTIIPARKISGGDSDETILSFLGSPLLERERSIIYGVGMAALLGIFVPSFRRKVQSLASRTAQEGAELMEKARFMLARTKEDIEDLIAEAGLRDFSD